MTTPAWQSLLLIKFSERSRCREASRCTEIQSAPASANAGMYSSGFSIIRWQSSGSLVAFRSDLTSCGPSVILGTKCPSITSTWIIVPPPSAALATWSARYAKSADKIDGASSINGELSGDRLAKFYHAGRPETLVVQAFSRASAKVLGEISPLVNQLQFSNPLN